MNELKGIAPQCKVSGLLEEHRVFIPGDGKQNENDEDPPKDFLGAHYIKNYEWIFTTLKEGQEGFVRERD